MFARRCRSPTKSCAFPMDLPDRRGGYQVPNGTMGVDGQRPRGAVDRSHIIGYTVPLADRRSAALRMIEALQHDFLVFRSRAFAQQQAKKRFCFLPEEHPETSKIDFESAARLSAAASQHYMLTALPSGDFSLRLSAMESGRSPPAPQGPFISVAAINPPNVRVRVNPCPGEPMKSFAKANFSGCTARNTSLQPYESSS